MNSVLVHRKRSSASIISLLLLLVFILYLMPSRIVEKPEKHETTAGLSSKSNQVAVDFPDPFAFHTPSPEEKYITYLPHSGFHNQRIELENAFLLAAYLNRTLLIPDVYLGNPAMPWLRFDKMYERILLQTKNGLDHCPQIPQGGPYPMECLNYDRWTKLPWTFFYDFEPLAADVPIVLRSDLSLEWLQSTLGIAKKDIQLMKDISPYEFRVYDHPKSKTPLAKFMNRYDVETLAAIDAKVLHFGSVFGSHRVLAQRPQHALWAMKVRTHMIFDTPVLVDTARQVVDQLGGTANFIGLHIRVGDGLFKVRASINIDDIYHALVNQFTDLTLDQLELLDNRHDEDRKERTDYEVKTLRVVSDVITSAPLSVDHTKLRSPDALGIVPAYPLAQQLSCRGQASDAVDTSRFCKTVVYIATDAPSGKDNPLLKKIRDTFPCVFDLSDFPFVFDRLGQVQVSDENVKLESYLIPMLDAIISAHGHTFFGTKDSTFTTYIERQLHPVYTSKEVPRSGPAVIE